MTVRRVDKIAFDGSSLTVTMRRHIIALRKASYGDKLETDFGSNMGSQQVDFRTPGSYSTVDPKFTMESVVFRAEFYPLMQKNGYGNEQLPIVVTESHPDLGDDSDLLDGVRFTGLDRAFESSNKANEVEFGAVFNQLYIGNERKTINTI